MSHEALRLRARLNRLVRDFFETRGVLEVETPVISRAGNTEPNIASFTVEFGGRTGDAPRTRWLRTSAEFPMKRLLAEGIGDCYELGRVFRDGEAGGRHNPEFTMLEWYRVGWTLAPLIDELYLEPSARGRGLGAALLAAACDWARARGAEVVRLEVNRHNPRAKELYLRNDFRDDDRDILSLALSQAAA